MAKCNRFGELDLANKIPRLKLILDIVQMVENYPNTNIQAIFLALAFLKDKMWKRQYETTDSYDV